MPKNVTISKDSYGYLMVRTFNCVTNQSSIAHKHSNNNEREKSGMILKLISMHHIHFYELHKQIPNQNVKTKLQKKINRLRQFREKWVVDFFWLSFMQSMSGKCLAVIQAQSMFVN